MSEFISESEVPAELLVAAVSYPGSRGSDDMPEVVYLAAEYILRQSGIAAEYNGERVIADKNGDAALNQFPVWHIETEYKNNSHIVTSAIRGYEGN